MTTIQACPRNLHAHTPPVQGTRRSALDAYPLGLTLRRTNCRSCVLAEPHRSCCAPPPPVSANQSGPLLDLDLHRASTGSSTPIKRTRQSDMAVHEAVSMYNSGLGLLRPEQLGVAALSDDDRVVENMASILMGILKSSRQNEQDNQMASILVNIHTHSADPSSSDDSESDVSQAVSDEDAGQGFEHSHEAPQGRAAYAYTTQQPDQQAYPVKTQDPPEARSTSNAPLAGYEPYPRRSTQLSQLLDRFRPHDGERPGYTSRQSIYPSRDHSSGHQPSTYSYQSPPQHQNLLYSHQEAHGQLNRHADQPYSYSHYVHPNAHSLPDPSRDRYQYSPRQSPGQNVYGYPHDQYSHVSPPRTPVSATHPHAPNPWYLDYRAQGYSAGYHESAGDARMPYPDPHPQRQAMRFPEQYAYPTPETMPLYSQDIHHPQYATYGYHSAPGQVGQLGPQTGQYLYAPDVEPSYQSAPRPDPHRHVQEPGYRDHYGAPVDPLRNHSTASARRQKPEVVTTATVNYLYEQFMPAKKQAKRQKRT